MSLREFDDGARAALQSVRAILQAVFNDEIEAAPADKIKRGLILISQEIERQLRRYEVSSHLVTFADPAARARYEAGMDP